MNRSHCRFRVAILVPFVTVVTVVLAASTSAAQSAETQSSQTTVIVGCLVQGLPDAAGHDTAAIARPDDYFVRTPTVTIPPGTSVAVGSAGTTSTLPSVGSPADDSFYRVMGLSADQLRPHLGHRIELQGRLTDNQPGIESTRARTTQDKDGRATTTVETRIAVAGVLHATAIKMVSATCPNPR